MGRLPTKGKLPTQVLSVYESLAQVCPVCSGGRALGHKDQLNQCLLWVTLFFQEAATTVRPKRSGPQKAGLSAGDKYRLYLTE